MFSVVISYFHGVIKCLSRLDSWVFLVSLCDGGTHLLSAQVGIVELKFLLFLTSIELR